MKVLHERVAGVDVRKDMIKVAIRSAGEKPFSCQGGSGSGGKPARNGHGPSLPG